MFDKIKQVLILAQVETDVTGAILIGIMGTIVAIILIATVVKYLKRKIK